MQRVLAWSEYFNKNLISYPVELWILSQRLKRLLPSHYPIVEILEHLPSYIRRKQRSGISFFQRFVFFHVISRFFVPLLLISFEVLLWVVLCSLYLEFFC